MLPKHKNPKKSSDPKLNRETTAPYNFIPLPEEIYPVSGGNEPWKHQDEYLKDTYSGWLDLTIKTETPLYVRCGISDRDEEEEEKLKQTGKLKEKEGQSFSPRHHFFHYGDENPVIPGSSLRGMVRNLVEILAFGKLSFSNDKQLVYRAVADQTNLGQCYRDKFMGPNQTPGGGMKFEYPLSEVKGGYLVKEGQGWSIWPAVEPQNESFVHVNYDPSKGYGDRAGIYGSSDLKDVYIIPPVRAARPVSGNPHISINLATAIPVSSTTPGAVKANLIRSGHMPGRAQKHLHCAIYEPNPSAALKPIPEEVWKLYEEDRDLHRGIITRKLGKDEPTILLKDKKLWPCFYLEEGGEIKFLGPTMMFRIPYEHKISEFIPQDSKFLDLAEAIFGRVQDKKADPLPTIKGRVFFEDAACQTENPYFNNQYEGRQIPKILAQPKPTSFQLYLVQPDDDAQNTLKNWNHKGQTVIRGFKQYWHKDKNVIDGNGIWDNNRLTKDAQDVYTIQGNAPSQHTIIRPVKANTEFKGRIRFENLTAIELGALMAALKLNGSGQLRHHLGMGKPYGMGTVKIEVKPVLLDRKERYQKLFNEKGEFESGEKPDSTTLADEAQKSFETTLLSQAGQVVQDYWEIPRIKDLLKMLTWPGPGNTDYKPLGAEWRERKVLPDPSNI